MKQNMNISYDLYQTPWGEHSYSLVYNRPELFMYINMHKYEYMHMYVNTPYIHYICL